MQHGEQQGLFDLQFRIPAECADLVAAGAADIGIIPAFELLGHDFGVVPGVGIACRGAVRSILLIAKRPLGEIQTLAADSSSRTSVALARIILARRYGAEPLVVKRPPDLASMLADADAALIIGDPALHIDPANDSVPRIRSGAGMDGYDRPADGVCGVGGAAAVCDPRSGAAFQESCAAGLRNIEEIVTAEAPARGFPVDLVRRYLTEHIVFELAEREQRGMDLFLRYGRELAAVEVAGRV